MPRYCEGDSMKTVIEILKERISRTTEPQTSKAEKSSDVTSLESPLPEPDPALKNYAEASEEIDHNKSTGDS
jgi:hypothetical protein